jgi:hypothetical protein
MMKRGEATTGRRRCSVRIEGRVMNIIHFDVYENVKMDSRCLPRGEDGGGGRQEQETIGNRQ